MDANRLLRDIFAILPKPILYGFLAGYLAVVVAWSPYPVGIATFLVFLFLESRNVRRDNR